MDYVECPCCGRKISSEDVEYLDNGNPACSVCVREEEKREEEKLEKNKKKR